MRPESVYLLLHIIGNIELSRNLVFRVAPLFGFHFGVVPGAIDALLSHFFRHSPEERAGKDRVIKLAGLPGFETQFRIHSLIARRVKGDSGHAMSLDVIGVAVAAKLVVSGNY